MIEEFIKHIPQCLLNQPGGVYYSGRSAFSGVKTLYILGLNPGGSPDDQSGETVEGSIKRTLRTLNNNWSAYRDESWEGAEPGTWRMQPRVIHLLNNLNLDAGEVPSSNVVFVRSQREKHINNRFNSLAEKCWPFHKAVIEKLNIKIIICLGKTAGNFVKRKLAANTLLDECIENNNRKWKSQIFESEQKTIVVVATHPSIADWTSPKTDPSDMIKRIFTKYA